MGSVKNYLIRPYWYSGKNRSVYCLTVAVQQNVLRNYRKNVCHMITILPCLRLNYLTISIRIQDLRSFSRLKETKHTSPAKSMGSSLQHSIYIIG